MMRWLGLASLFLTSAAQALTVADFQALEKRAEQGDASARAASEHYMAGIANTLAVIRDRQLTGAGPLVCAPPGVPIDAQEVQARYREFLQTHPDVYNLRGEILVPEVVLAGYDARYCGGTSSSAVEAAPTAR